MWWKFIILVVLLFLLMWPDDESHRDELWRRKR